VENRIQWILFERFEHKKISKNGGKENDEVADTGNDREFS
jgi:hypothetical protein